MAVGNSLNATQAGYQSNDANGTWRGSKIIGLGACSTDNQDGIAGDTHISVAPEALAQQTVTTTPIAAVLNTCYIANNASGITFNLPAIAAAGSIVEVVYQSGAWKIAPASGQQILYGTLIGTVSTGILTSKNVGDCIKLKCTVANTTWTVIQDHGQIDLS